MVEPTEETVSLYVRCNGNQGEPTVTTLDRIEKDGVLREEMTVRVEVKSQAGALDGLADHLRDRLKTDLGLKVDVELVPEGSLAEFSKGSTGEGKARRILDHRPGYLRK